MSIKIMSRVWDQPAASHTEKLILLCLADCASDEGVCWPSYGTIARKCQMERSRVIEAIARFEKRGLLKKKANRAANGHPSSNRYTLNIGLLTLEGGGALGAPRVVPQQHQGSAPRAPTLEPSLEPSDRRGRKPPVSAAPLGNGKPSATEMILRERELKRVEARIGSLRASYCDHQDWDAKDREELKTLKARRKELLAVLAFSV